MRNLYDPKSHISKKPQLSKNDSENATSIASSHKNKLQKTNSARTSSQKHILKNTAKHQGYNRWSIPGFDRIRQLYRSCVSHPNFLSFLLLFSATFTIVLSVVLLMDGFFCYGGLPKSDVNGNYLYDSENKLILHDYHNIWFWERNCENRCTGKDETDYCEPALNFESFLGAVLIVMGTVFGALWRESIDVNALTTKRENAIDLSTTAVLTATIIASPIKIMTEPLMRSMERDPYYKNDVFF